MEYIPNCCNPKPANISYEALLVFAVQRRVAAAFVPACAGLAYRRQSIQKTI
jgi:hypothetical protein